MQETDSHHNVVTVKNFPIGNEGPESPPRPQRRGRLPRAFIGYATRRYTYIPFSILLITSSLCIVAYLIMCYLYRRIISELELQFGILICILLCILNILASLMGLRFLENSIVTAGKLLLLHGTMFTAIVLNIIIPMYEFIPDNSTPSNHKNDVPTNNNQFPIEYWKCKKEAKSHLAKKSDPATNYCQDIIGVGYVFWSTLFLLVILLVAWKLSLCRSPTPIHPDARDSSHFDFMRYSARKAELGNMYQMWEKENQMNKPYYAHYPWTNRRGDENANMNERQAHIIPNVVVINDVIPSPK